MPGSFDSNDSTAHNLAKIPSVIKKARERSMLSSEDFKAIKELIKNKFNTFIVTTQQLEKYGTSVGEINSLVGNWHQHN